MAQTGPSPPLTANCTAAATPAPRPQSTSVTPLQITLSLTMKSNPKSHVGNSPTHPSTVTGKFEMGFPSYRRDIASKEVIGDGTTKFRSTVQGGRGPDRPGDGQADRAGGSRARRERGHAGSVGEPGPACSRWRGPIK